jgi:hypothetical protein
MHTTHKTEHNHRKQLHHMPTLSLTFCMLQADEIRSVYMFENYKSQRDWLVLIM